MMARSTARYGPDTGRKINLPLRKPLAPHGRSTQKGHIPQPCGKCRDGLFLGARADESCITAHDPPAWAFSSAVIDLTRGRLRSFGSHRFCTAGLRQDANPRQVVIRCSPAPAPKAAGAARRALDEPGRFPKTRSAGILVPPA